MIRYIVVVPYSHRSGGADIGKLTTRISMSNTWPNAKMGLSIVVYGISNSAQHARTMGAISASR